MQSWFTLCKAGLWFSSSLSLKTVGRRRQAENTFFPCVKQPSHRMHGEIASWKHRRMIYRLKQQRETLVSVCRSPKLRPGVRMITGWVITREKPALYFLGSQAGVVVFKRSPWVGASISPTGFVPQHRSRQSYICNRLSCTKPQGGNLHQMKWL